jgi:hypothetical protein
VAALVAAVGTVNDQLRAFLEGSDSEGSESQDDQDEEFEVAGNAIA